jgi:hypothetical protein
MGIASREKWLKIQSGSYFHTFLQPRNVAMQKRFFDRYLKGIDNDWENEPLSRRKQGFGELAPLTARACLPETWDNEQAVVATNALLRQYPDVGVPYAMMVAYASAYPCRAATMQGGSAW